jgi:uncharacterized protein YodC (DUF2158 family)
MIEVGDTVQLKYGISKMLVQHIGPRDLSGKDGAWCSWFEGNKRRTGWFELDQLVKPYLKSKPLADDSNYMQPLI